MFPNLSPTSFTLLVLAPATLAAYYLLQSAATSYRRARLTAQHGCKPVPSSSRLPGTLVWALEVRSVLRMLADATFFDWNRARHQRLGPTFRAPSILGPTFETCDPGVIRAVLSTHFAAFDIGFRKASTEFLLGNSIVNTDGPEWHRSRALLRPSFQRSDVANFAGLEHFVRRLLADLPADGSPVDLQPLFFALTSDAAIEYLLGERVHSSGERPNDTAARAFFAAYNRTLELLVNPFRDGVLRYFLPSPQFKADRATAFAYIDAHVRAAISTATTKSAPHDPAAHDDQSHTLVHSLAAQIPGEPLKIRSELLAALNAGRDPTASLLTNVWQVLSQRPDLAQRLRADIAFLDGAPPTYAQLKALTFLQWTLSESLRLHPVVPLNTRFAARDVVLPAGGGADGSSPLLVPKGASVLFDVYSMHRREDLFGPDVLEFRPDRWAALRPGWAFLPFHGGPRVCIGQQLALTEAAYTTVRLLQAFSHIESCDPEPWTPGFLTSLISRNGAKVTLRP